jgi:hypothetical protein
VPKPLKNSMETVADLQRRASEAMAVAADQSLLSWQRTLKALQAFSRTQLTGLPPILYRAMEKHFVAVNRILDNYHLEKDEDYSRMSEADLRKIRNIVKALALKIVPPD